jgi:anthranilate phosphoribosyltransferase
MSAMPSWPDLIGALLRGDSLSAEDTAWAMNEVMSGEATPVQVAGFVVALRAKGETADEVAGLVRTMLAHAARVPLSRRAVDTCGTGGDRAHTVNISTMAALVVRGSGVTVVKHGNRAASSDCGSADLLEALGVVVDLHPDAVARCVDDIGIGFCFAPVFHPALRHAAVARRELGIATVFNVLGPLTNPAQPAAQAVGVADLHLAPVLAGVLAGRGASALVFRGDDGLDELSISGPSHVWVVTDGQLREDRVDPVSLGIAASPREALRGGDAHHNAAVTRRFLDGESGPVRDAVLLNAAAALVAYDGPSSAPVADQIAAMLPRAAAAVDTGAARSVLEDWVRESRAAAATTPN